MEIHDDVKDLEKSSNNVDQDEGLISSQNPIIQPAQVTMETGQAFRCADQGRMSRLQNSS